MEQDGERVRQEEDDVDIDDPLPVLDSIEEEEERVRQEEDDVDIDDPLPVLDSIEEEEERVRQEEEDDDDPVLRLNVPERNRCQWPTYHHSLKALERNRYKGIIHNLCLVHFLGGSSRGFPPPPGSSGKEINKSS